MCNPICVRLRFADQGLEPVAEFVGGCTVEAVVHLSGIDQVFTPVPADIEAIPVVAIERKARNRQALPLSAGLIHPIVSAACRVAAVTDLGHDTFEPDLASVGEHLAAVDLEAFAELDVGPVDQLLEMRLALEQRHLPKVVAIEIEQIEGHQHDLVRAAFQLVLEHGEIGRAIRLRHHDFAVDDCRAGVDLKDILSNLAEALGPVMAAAGKHLDLAIVQVNLHAITVELDLVNPALAGRYSLDLDGERWVNETRIR